MYRIDEGIVSIVGFFPGCIHPVAMIMPRCVNYCKLFVLLVSVMNERLSLKANSPPPYYESVEAVALPRKTPMYRYIKYGLWSLILITLTVVGLSLTLILPHVQEYIDKSLEVDVQDVRFSGFSNGGIDIILTVDTRFDYRQLNSQYLTTCFSLTGKIFRTADIYLEDLDIKLLDEADENSEISNDVATIHLGKLKVPDFTVNIQQLRNTRLDLPITLKAETKELFRFLQKVLDKLEHRHSAIWFRVFISSNLKLNLGMVPIWNQFPIDYRNKVDLLGLIPPPATEAFVKLLRTLKKLLF